MKNLVIVESPAKAKTLEKFLGKEFVVKSCFGHIRDLDNSKIKMGIDIENNYKPIYVISPDKKKVVAELKKYSKQASNVWLATDEDREGEAIAWHLSEVLNLEKDRTKRIVFHEITKKAVLDAVASPRQVDLDMVNSQTARRVLDRLVGFSLSPLLWKKVKPKLSAGRVQSVAVKLLVEREREIIKFKGDHFFKITGDFKNSRGETIISELKDKIIDEKEIITFLTKCKSAEFTVKNIDVKPSMRNPSPPFTTSSLQQEASAKLYFSPARTMRVAQKLYEAGKITYMRTDSLNLSGLAVASAKKVIVGKYGEEYSKIRQFKTKSKGAQEAHEAIRPSYMNETVAGNTDDEKKLYNLIWKRTIASQMSPAQLKKTKVDIDISTIDKVFVAKGEVIVFDGFLKVYMDAVDDKSEKTGLLPLLKVGEKLTALKISAKETSTKHPARYTEASLIKKLEELGIGRPSTYATTLTNIQERNYVIKETREGKEREYKLISLENDTITNEKKHEIYGTEKNKLFRTDIGMVTVDYLSMYFEDIMDYGFTAKKEEELDKIAGAKLVWHEMIDELYQPLKTLIDEVIKQPPYTGIILLGKDPKSGRNVYSRMGKFGSIVQLGDEEDDLKMIYAGLNPGQSIETITLEEALLLFKTPFSKVLGIYENCEVILNNGKYGHYIKHGSKNYSIPKDIDDPVKIDLEKAIAIIEEKRKLDKKNIIKIFEEEKDLQILNGKYGPYISYKKKNYKIPKDKDPADLSFKDCMHIMEAYKKKPFKRSRKK